MSDSFLRELNGTGMPSMQFSPIPHVAPSPGRQAGSVLGASGPAPSLGLNVTSSAAGPVAVSQPHPSVAAVKSGGVGLRSPAPGAGSYAPLAVSAPVDLETPADEWAVQQGVLAAVLLTVSEQQHAHVLSSLLAELEKAFKEAAFFQSQAVEAATQALVLTKERDDLALTLGSEQRRSEGLAARVERLEGSVGSCTKQLALKDEQIAALHGELARLVAELDRSRLEAQRLNRQGHSSYSPWQPQASPPPPQVASGSGGPSPTQMPSAAGHSSYVAQLYQGLAPGPGSALPGHPLASPSGAGPR